MSYSSIEIAKAQELGREFPIAEMLYREEILRCQGRGDQAGELVALASLADLTLRTGHPQATLRLARRGRSLRQADCPAASALLLACQGAALIWQGGPHWGRGEECLRRASARANAAGSPLAILRIGTMTGLLLKLPKGQFAQSYQLFEYAKGRLDPLEWSALQAHLLLNRAVVQFAEGAREAMEQTMDGLEDAACPFVSQGLQLLQARYRLERKDPATACEQLARLRKLGLFPQFVCHYWATLLLALTQQGLATQAHYAFSALHQELQRHPYGFYAPYAYEAIAGYLCALGHQGEAVTLLAPVVQQPDLNHFAPEWVYRLRELLDKLIDHPRRPSHLGASPRFHLRALGPLSLSDVVNKSDVPLSASLRKALVEILLRGPAAVSSDQLALAMGRPDAMSAPDLVRQKVNREQASGARFILHEEETYRLVDQCWVDVYELEWNFQAGQDYEAQGLTDETASKYREVIKLGKKPFLENVWDDSRVEAKRLQIQAKWLHAREKVADFDWLSGKHKEAYEAYQELLILHPHPNQALFEKLWAYHELQGDHVDLPRARQDFLIYKSRLGNQDWQPVWPRVARILKQLP